MLIIETIIILIYNLSFSLFQFANQDKSYFKGKEDTLPEVNEEEDGAIKVEDEFIKPDLNFDVAIDYKIENTARVDKDYEKHFGRLYKTFDVRFLKGKIWESLKEVNLYLYNTYLIINYMILDAEPGRL